MGAQKWRRRGRDLCIVGAVTFVLLLVLEIIARGVYLVREGQKAEAVDERAYSGVYADAPWAEDYFLEFKKAAHTEWHSYVYWRRKPFAGTYINIDEAGVRKTYTQATNPDSALTVFLYGGSTLWGTGARDDYTIPSLLSKRLEQRGYDNLLIINFGETGYVSTQELIHLQVELQKGHIPDIVVFYDGVNDVFASYQSGEAGIPQNEFNRHFQFRGEGGRNVAFIDALRQYSALARGVLDTRDRVLPPPTAPQDLAETLPEETVQRYLANVEMVKALASTYQYEAFFFWQPTLYAKATPSTEERHLLAAADSLQKEFFDRTYAVFPPQSEALERVYTLQTIFDADTNTVFIDDYHIGERGNQIVADAIADTLVRHSRALNEARGAW